MFASISPRRNRFAPSFPTRSKHLIKKYNYKRTSIMDAIEHFKQQLSKIDLRSRKPALVGKEPQKSVKSINLVELTLPLEQSPYHYSQNSILANLPSKSSLPPLKNRKKSEYKEFDDLIFLHKYPIIPNPVKINRIMNTSKSSKVKKVTDRYNGKTKKDSRKRIELSNNNLFEKSSDSSNSLNLDPTLIDMY